MLADSVSVRQNIHDADLQHPCAGHRSNTAHHQISIIAPDGNVGCATVVVNIHRIARGVCNTCTIQSIQGKTNLLCAHSQLGLKRNVLLVLCADIGVDLTAPGFIVGSLKGIGFRTGQVVNVIHICCAIGDNTIGGIHLDSSAIVEYCDLGAQSISGQITIDVVNAVQHFAVLLQEDLLADHIAVKDNIPVTKFQLIFALQVGGVHIPCFDLVMCGAASKLHFSGCADDQIHAITGRIYAGITIQRTQGEAILFFFRNVHICLEGNGFLISGIDITYHTGGPVAVAGAVEGIVTGIGQVVNVIDIGYTVATFIGGIHLDGCAVVEVNDLGA